MSCSTMIVLLSLLLLTALADARPKGKRDTKVHPKQLQSLAIDEVTDWFVEQMKSAYEIYVPDVMEGKLQTSKLEQSLPVAYEFLWQEKQKFVPQKIELLRRQVEQLEPRLKHLKSSLREMRQWNRVTKEDVPYEAVKHRLGDVDIFFTTYRTKRVI